jgi:two-component system sensor histidine kinase/response regulator
MNESILKNAKILIVDDKESNIDILGGLLEESGYTNLESTTDPRQVVSLFRSFEPDLILLDLMMPHLSGFEVMDLLKDEIPPNTYLPILVLTADITIESKIQALSGGAKDFLSKPFDIYEVRLRIKNLLESRYLNQQLENQNKILDEKVKERTLDLMTANNDLDKANKELAVLDKAKNDFLSLISHEIKTPLNGILGFTDILKDRIQSPELLEFLHYLEMSARRLEEFSNKALLITELIAEKREIVINNISPDALIDKTIILFQKKIKAKGITFLFQKDQAIEKIKADSELIQICFEQLIDNLVNYSPYNEKIVIKIFAEEQSTICEFIDNGSGFTDKILDNPFIIFGIGDKHIDRNTGTNLALIKLIMDAHKGKIEVRNNLTKGATVTLIFNKQR